MRHLFRLSVVLGLFGVGQMALWAGAGNIATRDHPDPRAWPGYSDAPTALAPCPFDADMSRLIELSPAQERQVAVIQDVEVTPIAVINDRDGLASDMPIAVNALQEAPAFIDTQPTAVYPVLERVLTPMQLAQLPSCLAIGQTARAFETP
jgi:hypothetical protein